MELVQWRQDGVRWGETQGLALSGKSSWQSQAHVSLRESTRGGGVAVQVTAVAPRACERGRCEPGCLVQGDPSTWETLVLRHGEPLTSDLELVVTVIPVHRALDSHRPCSPRVRTLAVGSSAAPMREIQSLGSPRVLREGQSLGGGIPAWVGMEERLAGLRLCTCSAGTHGPQ